MNDALGVYIFCGKGKSSNYVYNYLKTNFRVSAIYIENKPSKYLMMKRRAKVLGVKKVLGQLLFLSLILPILKLFSKRRINKIENEFHLDDKTIQSDTLHYVENINEIDFSKVFKNENRAIIIINGTRIISKKTLKKIPFPIINIHVGITPLFRGVHGGYWSLRTQRADLFGSTLHFVDKGIDTGNVIKQVIGSPTSEDNFSTYPVLQYGLILPELLETIKDYSSGLDIETIAPMVSESKLNYHPTLSQWLYGYIRYNIK
ncbi:MAG: hypothetical protein J5I59_13290 [Saprospiraceae bacterium]|nr:hypothetical protein [Saprospiraceae bacterium]